MHGRSLFLDFQVRWQWSTSFSFISSVHANLADRINGLGVTGKGIPPVAPGGSYIVYIDLLTVPLGGLHLLDPWERIKLNNKIKPINQNEQKNGTKKGQEKKCRSSRRKE